MLYIVQYYVFKHDGLNGSLECASTKILENCTYIHCANKIIGIIGEK